MLVGHDPRAVIQRLDLGAIDPRFILQMEERVGPGGTEPANAMFSVKFNENALRLNIYLSYGDAGKVLMGIVDDPSEQKTLKIEHIKIADDLQGFGILKKSFRQILPLCDEHGIKKIELSAGGAKLLKFGSYIWARYGFDWLDYDKPKVIAGRIMRIQDNARRALLAVGLLHTPEADAALAEYERLLERAEHVSPYDVSEVGRNIIFLAEMKSTGSAFVSVYPFDKDNAGTRTPEGTLLRAVTLGQYAMFGVDWPGIMDLRIGPNGEKSTSRQRLEAYIGL
jgi:hypothetical protein